ncbi:glycoside hydrolase family 16 protein [Mucilaginibacter antarcticus]|uniref:glycoside hydrolase family 16 protein n=1 Tax=Mucilaginibacter antarcticus TaxID=1855725 RepID=UPI00362B1AFF
MKFLSTLFVMLCCAMSSSAQKADTLFFESFSGNKLNRAVWNVEVNNRADNNEQQAYADTASIIIIDEGQLTVKPIYHPGFSQNRVKLNDFVSGRINTRNKYEFMYGNVTARMRVTAGEGLWPAVWVLGKGKWPDAGEIDIMETVGDPTWASNAIHGPTYFGNTPLIQRNVLSTNNDVSKWHTYSCNIQPTEITFSIDGKVTYKVTKAMVEKFGTWVFDNQKYILLNLALGGGYPREFLR